MADEERERERERERELTIYGTAMPGAKFANKSAMAFIDRVRKS